MQRRISRANRLRAFTCRSAFHCGSTAVGSRTVRLCCAGRLRSLLPGRTRNKQRTSNVADRPEGARSFLRILFLGMNGPYLLKRLCHGDNQNDGISTRHRTDIRLTCRWVLRNSSSSQGDFSNFGFLRHDSVPPLDWGATIRVSREKASANLVGTAKGAI